AREDIVKYIDPADCDRMLKIMDKNNLLDTLDQTGAFTCTYRQLLDGRSQYVTMHVVRPRNDNNCIVIGVLNIDKQVRREQAAIAQKETYSQIVNALAKQYEVIYYIDLETDHYKEYSSSEKYAQLRMGESGLDFFGDTKRNMNNQIYPEDLPMMEKAMDRQQFINDLNETGTTSITYRLMLDNRPQYVNLIAIRPEENPRHVIIAVSNIDAAKQREMDFRAALGNAMDMANKDALTKVKNKHAYSHAVAEMDEDIAGRRSKEFAIAVLDINGLKNINDTRGHRVGDEYIKSCCRIICTTFKHSPVFRIGGDEFAVILTGEDYENRQILSDSFKSIMQSNAQRELATLAIGIAAYDRNMDTSVATVFERADNAMYENKKIYKDR
ncbi:MAG: GGDEF domain-containing protein, partial [Ruminococcus sp.]|nr:GGDEF domain-containing protein [Ruminococcus sp.]